MSVATVQQPGFRSLAEIRSDFPALERRVAGHPVAYFDGPGGTQVPRPVVKAMTEYLYHHNANTHWPYPTSAETDELILRSRGVLAEFLGCEPSDVVFGANMTTLTFHLARALARRWKAGDTVLVTELDHHANVDPWRALERERGIKVVAVPVRPETGQLDWDVFEQLVAARPRLLAIGGASNALGTINDVARAVAGAHQSGASGESR